MPWTDLARAIECLKDGVLVVNRDLTIGYANAAAKSQLGKGTLRGRKIPNPWQELDLHDFVRGVFERPAPQAEREVTLGERRLLVRAGCFPRRDSIVLLFINLTANVYRQDDLERELLTMAAHDLRTPLGGIANAVELLQRPETLLDESARDRFIAHIRNECARASSSVTALLTLARFERGYEAPKAESLPVRTILEELRDSVRVIDRERRMEIRASYALTVLANRGLLEHALRNLIENALKHGSGDVVVRARALRERALIEISDAGPGLPPEIVADITVPFYRRPGSKRGFGLGLTIAERATLALGGRLEVTSSPAVGTTIRVLLPRDPASISASVKSH